MLHDADYYIHAESPLHSWLAPYKIVGFILQITVLLFIKNRTILISYIGCMILLTRIMHIPLLKLVQRSKMLLLLLIFFIISLAMSSGGDIFLRYRIFSFVPVTCYYSGLDLSIFIVLRSISIWLTVHLLLATSRVTALLHGSLFLRVPIKLSMLFFLTYRYLFRYQKDLDSMKLAARLRGNRTSTFSIPTAARIYGSLLVRSHEDTEKIYHSMVLRGLLDKDISTIHFRPAFKDIIFLIIAFVTGGILLLFEKGLS